MYKLYIYCTSMYIKNCTLSDTPASFGPVLTLEKAFLSSQLFCIFLFFPSHLTQIYLSFRTSTSHFLFFPRLFLIHIFLSLHTHFSFFSSSLHLFPKVIFLSLILFLFFLFPFSPLPHIFSFFRASFLYMYNVHIFSSSPRSFLFFFFPFP
jgi:hypothetical protein